MARITRVGSKGRKRSIFAILVLCVPACVLPLNNTAELPKKTNEFGFRVEQVSHQSGKLADSKIAGRVLEMAGSGSAGRVYSAEYSDLCFPNLGTKMPVWIVEIKGVKILLDDPGACNPPCRKTMDMQVAVDSAGSLVAFWTEIREKPYPARLEVNSASRLKSTFGADAELNPPCDGTARVNPKTRLNALLAEAWRAGIPLNGALCVVGRWAILATRVPAREVDGRWIPIRSPGPGWLVSGLGYPLHYTDDYYKTESHVLIDDRSNRFLWGFDLP